MKVKFLVNYNGAETEGRKFKAGDIADLAPHLAHKFIHAGIIEKYVESPVYFDVEPQFENAAEPPRRKRGKQ